jgi:hypothetical protein
MQKLQLGFQLLEVVMTDQDPLELFQNLNFLNFESLPSIMILRAKNKKAFQFVIINKS